MKRRNIEPATLVLADGRRKKTFPVSDKQVVSIFKLPTGVTGKVIAISRCNLHDLWITKSNISFCPRRLGIFYAHLVYFLSESGIGVRASRLLTKVCSSI